MVISKALAKYVRISAFKVRRIANEIVGKDVVSAESYLSSLTNKGAFALKKVIHSARTSYMAQNANTEEENLIVSKILVDKGSTMKRFQPIGKGRANRILKRSCHIYAEVTSNVKGDK